jgi:hypothetical protein
MLYAVIACVLAAQTCTISSDIMSSREQCIAQAHLLGNTAGSPGMRWICAENDTNGWVVGTGWKAIYPPQSGKGDEQ